MSLSLSINEFSNQCRYIGRAEDVGTVTSELNQLTPLLLDAISQQLALELHDAAGIYCIRQLNLSLTLSRRQLSARSLSRLLAQQLNIALNQVLLSLNNPADCRYFADEAHYIAAFIQSLLQYGKAELWLFAQYHSLRHLHATDAIVQLLLPRLALLTQIGAVLRAQQQHNALYQQLTNEQAQTLLQHWLGDSQLAPFSTVGLPLATLVQLQQHFQQTDRQLSNQPLALSVITCLLLSLPLTAGLMQLEPRRLLLVIMQRQLLRRCRTQLSAILQSPQQPLLPGTCAPDAELQPLLADARHWLALHPTHQSYLLQCLSQFSAGSFGLTAALTADNSPGVASTAEVMSQQSQYYSNQAALVLLLPVLLGLRLHQYYSASSLRLALLQAVEPELDSCAAHGWLLQLLPDHSCANNDSPELPPLWRQGLSLSEQQHLAQHNGCPQLSELLLRHFAGRLSGLQRSSLSYLRLQFLQGGGVITLHDDRISVRLNPIALAIVLQMAGLADWCDSLPWLNKNLLIEVAG